MPKAGQNYYSRLNLRSLVRLISRARDQRDEAEAIYWDRIAIARKHFNSGDEFLAWIEQNDLVEDMWLEHVRNTKLQKFCDKIGGGRSPIREALLGELDELYRKT